MAVQFNCSSCGKPIEIDDEFAGQSVTCPYCRTVVRAVAGGSAPVASPLGGAISADVPPQMGAMPFVPPPAARPNWFATASMICGLIIIVTLCVAVGTMVPIAKKYAPNGQVNPADAEKIQKEFVQQPIMKIFSVTNMVAAIVGFVFAILGLTRRQGRKWQAIVGLTLCSLVLACGALGIIGSVMAPTPAG